MSSARVIVLLLIVGYVVPAKAKDEGFESSVDVLLTHDSNLYRRSQNITSDFKAQLSPKIGYATEYGKHTFAAKYEGEYTQFADTSEANYENHDLSLSGEFQFSQKAFGSLRFTYKDEIEAPGINNASLLNNLEFNQRDQIAAVARLGIGTTKSIGQLVTRYERRDTDYTNNFQEFRSFISDAFNTTFFYRIAPKTRLLLDTRFTDSNFKNTLQTDQSSSRNTYLLGVEWAVTAITGSSFRVGYQDTDFESDNLPDLSGFSFELDIEWKPNTYSILTLAGSRTARESAIVTEGGFIGTDFDINFTHEVTRKINLDLGYKFSEINSGNDQRGTDIVHTIESTFSYKVKRWMTVNLIAAYSNRQSDLALFQFNVVEFGIGTNIKL